mgnify:CR=1 FL=1
MEMLAHRARIQKLPQPGRLRAGVAERVDRLFVGQAAQRRGRHRPAERAVHYGCLVQVVDFENMGKAAQHQRPAAGIALLSLQVGKQLFARN